MTDTEFRYDYITPQDYLTAEMNGIPSRVVEVRAWNYGWDIDRSVTQKYKAGTSFESVWSEWGELATSNGISRADFYRRVKGGKQTPLVAATKNIKPGPRSKYNWTDEERAIAKKNGLDKNSMNLVVLRMKKGMSREDALNTPKITEKERAERVREGTRKYHRENKKRSKTMKGSIR